MNVEELTKYANEFLRKEYSMELAIPIVRNGRLRRTLGSFVTIRGEPKEIELAGYLLDYGAKEPILDVLYHELIHYALFTQGRSYRDGCVEFETELRKHGVSSSGTPIKIGKMVAYYCAKCGKEYESNRMSILNRPQKYRSRCCSGNINVIDVIIYDGTTEE